MKLLLDENLSPRLTVPLQELYPNSDHVHNLDLGGALDDAIWAYAKKHGFAIVSKDSDFAERSVLQENAPKIIWIRLGNCSTLDIERLLLAAFETIRSFLGQNEETCLLLGRRQYGS